MYWLQFSLASENEESAGQQFWTAATRPLITLFKHPLAHKRTHTHTHRLKLM